MKILLSIVSLVLTLTFRAHAEVPTGWSTNFTAALTNSTSQSAPCLLFFTASWCQPCKLMTRVTLSEATVQEALTNLRPVAIDIDEYHDFAATWQIEAVPTFVIVSASGEEIGRTTGFQDSAPFVQWLTNGVSGAQKAATRQELAEKRLAEVDQLMASTNVESLHQAAAALFDLCAERQESVVQQAAGRLKKLASDHPAIVLDGLTDPHLATRIHVANLLRERLGEGFGVDPWGARTERTNAIEKWRQRLSSVNAER